MSGPGSTDRLLYVSVLPTRTFGYLVNKEIYLNMTILFQMLDTFVKFMLNIILCRLLLFSSSWAPSGIKAPDVK